MKIDASIVTDYLQGRQDYAGHWLFSSLRDGEYLFDPPSPAEKGAVEELLTLVYGALRDFVPYNRELFCALFPHWREQAGTVEVLLAVGCPAPYDAMVREQNGKQSIVFDLIRCLEYKRAGVDIPSLMRKLITHELAHVCIHRDYPACPAAYREKLGYITFDEGFAHALAFAEDMSAEDLSAEIGAHYQDSVQKLRAALAETSPQKQKQNLLEANSGTYWGKFAAMSGKLYLLAHRDEMEAIYKAGPEEMLAAILGDR